MTDKISQNLKGQRASKNRDLVVSILIEKNMPISVEDIFCIAKTKNNKISLSTVYRIIDKLCELNIVRKVTINEGKTLFELTQNGHRHYLICTKCKKMIPLDTCPIKEMEKKISADTGFHVTGHKYELYGECEDCYQKNK